MLIAVAGEELYQHDDAECNNNIDNTLHHIAKKIQ
jgi:hypothetical protein